MIEAAVIAGELAQDGEWYNGHVVYVTDEHGNEIGRVPVVTAFSRCAAPRPKSLR